jgi:hypothetical protein
LPEYYSQQLRHPLDLAQAPHLNLDGSQAVKARIAGQPVSLFDDDFPFDLSRIFELIFYLPQECLRVAI